MLKIERDKCIKIFVSFIVHVIFSSSFPQIQEKCRKGINLFQCFFSEAVISDTLNILKIQFDLKNM